MSSKLFAIIKHKKGTKINLEISPTIDTLTNIPIKIDNNTQEITYCIFLNFNFSVILLKTAYFAIHIPNINKNCPPNKILIKSYII